MNRNTTTTHKKGRTKIFSKTLTASVIASIAMFAANAHEMHDNDVKQKPTITITTETSSEETTDWGNQEKDGRSRLGMSNMKLPGKTSVMKSTTEISQVIEVKQRSNELLCESDIDLEYYQKDTATEVRTLFSSENCDEFDARYQLRIMYFDANGEVQRVIADEEWPVGRDTQLRKTYPLEANSELQRVTSRILSCTCK